MTDILVLGGTGWLSGRIAELWLGAGASVTCLARGGRAVPSGARLVAADRDASGAYDSVADRDWDEIVDISSRARHVEEAVAALAGRTRHWTCVSTVSVYAANDQPGSDEKAPLLEAAEPGDADDYGREKVAAENAVRSALGLRAAIVRPGLIVGRGDPTDRFGYWVSRFALAGDGPVLVPDLGGRGAQVIDVDDLAAFIVSIGRERWTGVVNAVGDRMPLTEVLRAAAEVAAFAGSTRQATDDWLAAHDVAHWAGPRSLPLWLPRDMTGFWQRSNTAYRLLGGRLRPVRETLASTLADERERGLDRERRSGLSRTDELALLDELSGPAGA